MARFIAAAALVLLMATLANSAGHGPCVTEMGYAADKAECWTLIYSEVQKDQPNNPSRAKFGDDYAKAKAAYPVIAKFVPKLKSGLADNNYKLTSKWSPSHPYVRVCVPSAKGRSSCGLKSTDFLFHVNPAAASTTAKATLFYKGFVKNNQIAYAGKSAH